MKHSPIDDLFKTTFECPVSNCAHLYNTEEDAKDHIWTEHGTDDEPKLNFESLPLEYVDLLNTEEVIIKNQKKAEVIADFSPELLMSKKDPLLSQSMKNESCLETIYLPTEEEVLNIKFLDLEYSEVIVQPIPDLFDQNQNYVSFF